jgi:hypothetical protein
MNTLTKIVRRTPMPSDGELLRRGLARQIDRTTPGVGSADRRIVIGEVESPHVGGRVFVEHDQGADVVMIHGVSTLLADIDRDLRIGFVEASAHFSAAQTALEQTNARELVGVVVDSILRRHDDFVGAAVREKRERAHFSV